MKPEEVFAALTTFQQALAAHFDWLHRWYHVVLNRADGGKIPDAAACACPFDHWHRQAAATRLAEFPGFAQMAAEHDEVHDKAAQLSGRALAGLTVTTSDYETLMGSVLAFGATTQGFEREVWKVLATVDPLTGLANRQSMRTHLNGERDRALRQRLPLAVALADIDHFKRINDGFGHAQGDKVLRAIAATLKTTVRPYDVVYRYGGEEFLLCLPGTNCENATLVLERIRAAIEDLRLTCDRGTPIPVTATFGVAEVSADLSVDDAIEMADRALYDGKLSGRNRVVSAIPST